MSIETLLRRTTYGGRKGRSAERRIRRWARRWEKELSRAAYACLTWSNALDVMATEHQRPADEGATDK